jgi:DNA-binding transcriptional MerR regulator
MQEGKRWKVGSLARATGLTVRTLHHYEHLGLLPSAARTEGRQRLYDEGDVRKLYRIRALTELGLSLAEVRRTLEGKGAPLAALLRSHRARVEAELLRLEQLRDLLDHASSQTEKNVPAEELLATIEAMSKVMRRKSGKNAEARWRKLGVQLRACMKSGAAPSSRRAQSLARIARDLIAEFSGGDREVEAALSTLRKSGPTKTLEGWTPALIRYLDEALKEEP